MLEQLEGKFTRYEIARILGARSLQLAMDAPILIKLTQEELDDLHFDTLKIAEKELAESVLPITVRRPMPKKSEKTIKKLSADEVNEKLEKQDEEERPMPKKVETKKPKSVDGEGAEEGAEGGEAAEDAEHKDEGEIMEMATPEDEVEVEDDSDTEEF